MEEYERTRQSPRPSLQGAPFTASFMGICVLVFVAGMLSRNLQQQIFIHYSQINVAVGAGEWWRLLTAAFLHAGPAHIAFNMWALLVLGPPLERQLGPLTFGSMCFACAAWGGAAAYLLTDPRSGVVGASAAIFGVFGVWLYASYFSRATPMGRAQFRNFMTLLAINAFLGFAIPHISWQGHAGGLAAGILIAAAWRQLGPRATASQRALVAGATGAIAILIVLLNPLPRAALRFRGRIAASGNGIMNSSPAAVRSR